LEHARKNEQQRQAFINANRPSSTALGYDGEWRKARSYHLAFQPLCVMCGAPATQVDHINPISTNPELRLAPSNLRSLCHSCHSRRTARDQGFAKRSATP
jgi:5-methylcytosine-specific restriction endonuclease McrA